MDAEGDLVIRELQNEQQTKHIGRVLGTKGGMHKQPKVRGRRSRQGINVDTAPDSIDKCTVSQIVFGNDDNSPFTDVLSLAFIQC